MGEYFRVNVQGPRTSSAPRRPAGPGGDRPPRREVYGPVPTERQPIREEEAGSIRARRNAMTKAAAELLGYAHGAVVVRAFNLVGTGAGAELRPPRLRRPASPPLPAVSRRPVLKGGNLSARRDFLHVDDAARRPSACWPRRGEPAATYNLASGRGTARSGEAAGAG